MLFRSIPGFRLTAQGEAFAADSPSLAEPQALHDIIERQGDDRFVLVDRSSNLINVAGKRSSLGFLNQTLQSLPGVQDGVFFLPPGAPDQAVARLAAFVVAPAEVSNQAILGGLRQHIDALFLPRPIIRVPALPRDANAKLPAAALQALIAQHLPSSS